MEQITDKVITKTRTVDCSLDTLWWKWTTREGLLTFFGPDNSIEFKIGGKYEIYFLLDNPKGLQGGEGNEILSYLPKHMFSFSWNAPPEYPEIRNHRHKTWVVVNFSGIDETKTAVTLSHLGWLKGSKWDEVFDYFNEAWDRVMDWLEESCKD